MKNIKENIITFIIVAAITGAFTVVAEIESNMLLAATQEHLEYVQGER